MKIPLRFQITDFDCGTVSLQNAISFLFDREDIPAALVRAISLYTLDCYDSEGNLGQGGTSIEAVNMMCRWISDFASKNDFGIKCNHLENKKVELDIIKNCLKKNGCVLLRTYLDGDHYVLVTDCDDEYVYVWDPYYLEEKYYDKEKNVLIELNQPFKYNRKILITRFNSHMRKDFALGPYNKRECVLFFRNN